MKCPTCNGSGKVDDKPNPRPVAAKSRRRGKFIKAGENLRKGGRVVVDERTGEAFRYPRTPIIPGICKLYGFARESYRKGESVTLEHWCFGAEMLIGRVTV